MLERYNHNVFKELDCSIMNQSNQINNVSAISAGFVDGDNAPTTKAPVTANENACQISFGIQDSPENNISKVNVSQGEGKAIHNSTTLDLV